MGYVADFFAASLQRKATTMPPQGFKTAKRKLTAVGAYIFAGGFTVGVKAAGFNVLAHLEDGPFGVATARLNHPDVPIHQVVEQWPLTALKEKSVDLVYCNPPCSVFSLAGYSPKYGSGSDQSDKWRTDPLTSCFKRAVSLGAQLSPSVLVIESVQQAFTRGHDLVWDSARELTSLGYGVDFVLLDASRVGLPQRRRRAFLVATKMEIDWEYDHEAAQATVRDAIGDLADDPSEVPGMTDFYRRSLAKTLPGEELRAGFVRVMEGQELALNKSGGVIGRPAFVYRRLAWDEVAPTLLGGPRYFHPEEERLISVREFQVLCGYPPDYEFVGRVDEKYPLIAKAVTPTVGEWLASRVRAAIELGVERESSIRLVDLEKSIVKYLDDGEAIRPSTLVNRRSNGVVTVDDELEDDVNVETASEVILEVSDQRQVTQTSPTSRQPIRGGQKKKDREEREFDQTFLSDRQHGKWVHRDYAAHFFRWGFAAERFVKMKAASSGIGPVKNEGRVLDVGCGPELNFMKTIIGTPNVTIRPEVYVGVDVSPLKSSRCKGVELRGEFDFTTRWTELTDLGPFDVTVCYEVVEHMSPDAALALMSGVRELMTDDGAFFMSTPVFDGFRARNHIHEFTIDELADLIVQAGLNVEDRFGTFASLPQIKKACTPQERAVLDDLSRYYRNDVLSCFLAPLYPDASRNNLWVLRKA